MWVTILTNIRYYWFWLWATDEERKSLMSPRAFRKKYIEPAVENLFSEIERKPWNQVTP
jgi:hypothetical protein